jgi:hypothetical protein
VVSHPCDKDKNIARMGHPADFDRTRLHRIDRGSAFFAVEHIAHGLAALGVQTAVCFRVADCGDFRGGNIFRLTAFGTAVGEAGLAWAEFELFPASDTGFNRKPHDSILSQVISFPKGLRRYGGTG